MSLSAAMILKFRGGSTVVDLRVCISGSAMFMLHIGGLRMVGGARTGCVTVLLSTQVFCGLGRNSESSCANKQVPLFICLQLADELRQRLVLKKKN